eukprot:CAMPEP_0170077182 /NCGR_PEP_ID=MMETSP0019_2-20121128/14052_1 /TAXON_ID=98059 /ORGANISM="Dinobryon sp., Strain UTEXLB2267" /LENGTH=248 /DNA_ID=CAMNT_0010289361 /DNA_START=335 /DNA_END=1081 /DNA_ORIENTATION=+
MSFQRLNSQNEIESVFIAYGGSHRERFPEIFTFVRDPFDRFIAGFTEAVFCTYRHERRYEEDKTTMLKANISEVKAYLDSFLNFQVPLILMGHFYAMSGVFFRYHIQTIGYLENFQKDWENIIQPKYNITKPYDNTLGVHATSMHHPIFVAKNATRKNEGSKESKAPVSGKNVDKDPNDARKLLLQLLNEDKRYKQAICHLILVDYICLPSYTLPLDCQFLNATRDNAMAAVKEDKYVPHKISLSLRS